MAARRDSGVDEATGERYAVTSGCAEASRAAAACLAAGGNVVDAALAASAVTCVVLPNATSIGGDLFALVKLGDDAGVVALNATGAAPARASIDAYRRLGHRFVPERGGLAVQGPGLVAGWQALHERWGGKPLAELLAPAIDLAHNGSAVGWRLAGAIAEHLAEFSGLPGWRDVFAPGGRPLAEGDRLVQAHLAATLARIAAQGARAFYEGPVARDIARSVAAAGGFLDEADLATIKAEIQKPLTARYRDLEIHTQPPISQGLILLRALRLLAAAAPEPRRLGRAEFWAQAARSLDKAFDERLALMGDGAWARDAAQAIIEGRAAEFRLPRFENAQAADNTSALSVMDAEGNGVAIIQSVYAEFGSGVVGVESGVLLNNRLIGFLLDPEAANALAPGRRTMHTLHSFMALDAKGLRWLGGSPGGDNQPQVNLQVLARLLDFGEAPSVAVGAPRWSLAPGTKPRELAVAAGRVVETEPGVPAEVREGLVAAGFTVREKAKMRAGSSKIVGRGPHKGTLGAWADWRREGAAAAG
jgi:gamma-glutamyltranspeptidase/glutathione hydrolase